MFVVQIMNPGMALALEGPHSRSAPSRAIKTPSPSATESLTALLLRRPGSGRPAARPAVHLHRPLLPPHEICLPGRAPQQRLLPRARPRRLRWTGCPAGRWGARSDLLGSRTSPACRRASHRPGSDQPHAGAGGEHETLPRRLGRGAAPAVQTDHRRRQPQPAADEDNDSE